jgi:hypothetical protein
MSFFVEQVSWYRKIIASFRIYVFLTQKMVTKLWEIWVGDPGPDKNWSQVRIPNPDPSTLPNSLIDQERKRSHISLRLVGILKQFLGLAVTTNFPQEGGMATLTKYFNEIVPPCVR